MVIRSVGTVLVVVVDEVVVVAAIVVVDTAVVEMTVEVESEVEDAGVVVGSLEHAVAASRTNAGRIQSKRRMRAG